MDLLLITRWIRVLLIERPEKLIIWGASGHARVIADIIRMVGQFEVVAFFNDKASNNDERFVGVKLLKTQEQLDGLFNDGVRNIILGFGNCTARLNFAEVALRKGFELCNAIHPHSIVAQDVIVGNGSVVVAGAVINPGTSVGRNVIINTNASVDHECVIEDGAHIGPGARLGGRVVVERGSWVGIGATVKDRIRVGANSIVGAGALVLRDVPRNTVVFGVPAKVIRPVKPNEN